MNVQIKPPSAATTSFIGRNHGMLIDGENHPSRSGAVSDIIDPGRGKIICQVSRGDAADVDIAVRAARKAFENAPWRSIKPNERSKLLWRLADLMEQHAETTLRSKRSTTACR